MTQGQRRVSYVGAPDAVFQSWNRPQHEKALVSLVINEVTNFEVFHVLGRIYQSFLCSPNWSFNCLLVVSNWSISFYDILHESVTLSNTPDCLTSSLICREVQVTSVCQQMDNTLFFFLLSFFSPFHFFVPFQIFSSSFSFCNGFSILTRNVLDEQLHQKLLDFSFLPVKSDKKEKSSYPGATCKENNNI